MKYIDIPFENRSSRWSIQKQVGQGRHGTAHIVRDTTGEHPGDLLMKELRFMFTDTQASSYDEYVHEVELHVNISELLPDYVPKIYDYWVHLGAGYIVMEYFPRGEHPQMCSVEEFDRLCQMWHDMAELGYFHGDYKLTNIFVADDGRPVIGDWGVAVYLPAFTVDAMNALLSEQMEILRNRETYRAIYMLLADIFQAVEGDDRRPVISKMLEFEMKYRLHYGFEKRLKFECGKRLQTEIMEWIQELVPEWEINASKEFFDIFIPVIGWIRDNLWIQSLEAHRRQSIRRLTNDIIHRSLYEYITRDDIIQPIISQNPRARYVNKKECLSSIRRKIRSLLEDDQAR